METTNNLPIPQRQTDTIAATDDNPDVAANVGGAADTEESFTQMLDGSLTRLRSNTIVKGTVVRVTANEVIVDLGYKSDGIITRNEFSETAVTDLTEHAKPGDVLEVLVLRINDTDGNVLVSKKRVDSQANYALLQQAMEEKTALEGKVKEVVKGGMIATILGYRAFVPASQASNRTEKDLEKFVGETLQFRILELERSKRRVIAGRRDLLRDEQRARRTEAFAGMEVGQVVVGRVSRIVDFGAFIDLGGLDGLIHVSEVSWKRVRRVADFLSVGDEVHPYVIALDREKGKVSLSLRHESENPWAGITERYPIGSIVDGTVARLAPFGAFVTLEDGVDGLVHISQIANKRVAKTDDELTTGQIIQVMIMHIDIENRKVSLSKREADAILYPQENDEYYDDEYYETDADEHADEYADEHDEHTDDEAPIDEAPTDDADADTAQAADDAAAEPAQTEAETE